MDTSAATNHMNEEDRRASRVPIRAVRQLHSRGGRPTPGYLNWDDADGVWRNNHGETPEEGRARQAQKEEAAREREAALSAAAATEVIYDHARLR